MRGKENPYANKFEAGEEKKIEYNWVIKVSLGGSLA